MRVPQLVMTALFATTLFAIPAFGFAADDTPAKSSAGGDKIKIRQAFRKGHPETAARRHDAGIGDRGRPDHRLYSRRRHADGGSTDVQDAQLDMDGRPMPGSQLAISEPKEPKDSTPFARIFYVAYFKKDAKAEDRPITFFYTAVRAVRPSGCTWVRSAPSMWSRIPISTCPPHPTSWSTMSIPCSTPATWFL